MQKNKSVSDERLPAVSQQGHCPFEDTIFMAFQVFSDRSRVYSRWILLDEVSIATFFRKKEKNC